MKRLIFKNDAPGAGGADESAVPSTQPAPQAAEKPVFMNEGSPVGMRRRLSFNEDAANYEKRRPGYPAELFEQVIRYSDVGAGKRALEVGIGTGKATEPILKTGCAVTAVELGENLAGYVRKKFRAYPNFSVENLSFEAFQGSEGGFDLVYSATAFHWVPEEIGFPKAFRLLKSGGALALWWNRAFVGRKDDPLHQEIQRLYGKYGLRPGGAQLENDTARWDKIRETIRAHGFAEPDFLLFHGKRNFDAEEYTQLLNTYSDHRGLEPEIREKFESEIRRAILDHGNRLTVYDTVDLYLARKP